MNARRIALVLMTLTTLLAGCDGRFVAAGNLALATVPCVLLWLTVNLKNSS